MSTNVNVLDRNPVSTPVSSSMAQPQVGSLNKEVPIASELSELKPAGPEVKHTIDQELSELNVQETVNNPDLTKAHAEVGIKHGVDSIPVPTTLSSSIQYPMSEEEITDKLNTGQDDDSGKWLAGLIRKIIKVMGL